MATATTATHYDHVFLELGREHGDCPDNLRRYMWANPVPSACDHEGGEIKAVMYDGHLICGFNPRVSFEFENV